MKNKLFLIMMLSVLCMSAKAQSKNHLTQQNLKGDIKTLTFYYYKASGNSGNVQKGDLQRKQITSFNEMGNIIIDNSYNSDGILFRNIVYKYDDKGNDIEIDVYKEDGSLDNKILGDYDENGNCLKRETFKSNGSLDKKEIFKYDKNGNVIELEVFNSDGSLNYKMIYKFDKNSNVIERKANKSDGSLYFKIIYKFDDKKNEIELENYKSDGSLGYKTTSTYDYALTGNWIKRTVFKDDIATNITERDFTDKEDRTNIEQKIEIKTEVAGKQIFHDDFNDNSNGWQDCTISGGQLVTTGRSILKSINLTEDFMIRTSVSTSNSSDHVFLAFGYLYRVIKNPYNNYSNFQLCNYRGSNLYYDNEKNNPKINIAKVDIKITCINKQFKFYANNTLLYTTTFDWLNAADKSIYFSGSSSANPRDIPQITYADYLYIDEIVISTEEKQRRNDIIESDFYASIKSSKDYDSYLTKYPNGKYFNEISTLKEDQIYNLALSGFITECENYINRYPSGKYVTQIQKIKEERVLYKSALYGAFKEYDAYLLKYPNGNYASEISSLKAKKLYEIDRQKKIKANSNKALWKTGNKICFESSSGTICGTLMGWNEDKSMIQLKVISGPNIRIEGEQVKPDALIWITPDSEWHICLQDEIDASVAQNEDPYKYWKLGKKICLSGTKGSWFFKSNITIIGEIIQWNEDKSKVRIRIIDGASGTIYNSETLYNDKMIWDSPNGWKLCN